MSDRIEPLFKSPRDGEIRWRLFRGGLSGRYFTAKMRYHANVDGWEVVGEKHDVTDDVRRYMTDEHADLV